MDNYIELYICRYINDDGNIPGVYYKFENQFFCLNNRNLYNSID